jgi:aryl-alcohol dehydrogenase-like predicted oxidoreductase
VREIAARYQVSVAQVALAWLLHQAGVSSVIVGASKMSQLEDNFGAAAVQLSPADLAQLEAATALGLLYPHWFAQFTADSAMRTALYPASA